MSSPTIVVAEDDVAIRDLLSHHLEREALSVIAVGDGHAALRSARHAADLLILDVGLPGLDGFDVLRTLRREARAVPIIVLTARTDEIDRVVGFELGADDYVCKPFGPREVIARVRAVLRRSGHTVDAAPANLQFGRLQIDEAAREVRVDGRDVRLKPREFALLLELASHPGIALSRERLVERVWGFDFEGDERTVDVHVRRLRAKIEETASLPPIVQTIHGFGYKWIRARNSQLT
jgi:DNA-binding response OmpR family regulator